MDKQKFFNVVIIGGSYAGLAAALSLGRAGISTVIIDSEMPCNRQTPFSHNFLTQDGKSPIAIAKEGIAQILNYPAVEMINDTVIEVSGENNNFTIYTAIAVFHCSKLILATGIIDQLPDIKGFVECWGKSIIHCPFCHGYEYRNKSTALLMNGEAAVEHALFIQNWAGTLKLLTHGVPEISDEKIRLLKANRIDVIECSVREIIQYNGKIQSVVFNDGQSAELDVMYAVVPFKQHQSFSEDLGCVLTSQGYIDIDELRRTSVKGIYAAGDNSSPMRSVAGAVAAGTTAGAMVAKEIIAQNVVQINNDKINDDEFKS